MLSTLVKILQSFRQISPKFAEAYSEPYQTSKMELKAVNNFRKALHLKCSIQL